MRRRRFILVPALTIDELAAYHYDVIASLRMYFNPSSPAFTMRFAGQLDEITNVLELRLAESDVRSALTVMTSLEAYFRTDFSVRCHRRLKDDLSLYFRELERTASGSRVRLDDILEGWKRHSNMPSKHIGQLRGAFEFRHWLAHGRYWSPKLGHKYDFDGLHYMAKTVISTFPFAL